MNILLLTRFLSAEAGGGYYLFVILAELLAKSGHKVWVITNKIKGIENPKHENIKVIFVTSQSLDEIHQWNQKNKIRYLFSAIKIGVDLVKKEKIDIIHSNPIYPIFAGSMISLLTSTPHIKAIYDLHSLQEKTSGNFRGFLEKIMLMSSSSAIHAISESNKDDLLRFGAKKPIYVIPVGIPFRRAEEIKPEPYQLVSIGRLAFHKNIQVAIKAIKIVKKSFPNVSLVVVGDGLYRKNLEELVDELGLQDNVVFSGQALEEDKIKLLASSQALVFPSFIEGFGIVILEAFAQKKPALVSNVRPMTDIVEDEKTGFVIPAHDEKAWAEALGHILREPKQTQKMGEAGRDELEEKYGNDNMTKKILQMYNKVIKKVI